jgi:hypothetical protein
MRSKENGGRSVATQGFNNRELELLAQNFLNPPEPENQDFQK